MIHRDDFPTLPSLEEERIWGVHSGIPMCCVEAFVSCTMRMGEQRAWVRAAGRLGFKYHPCSACYEAVRAGKATPAVLHVCTIECIAVLAAAGCAEIAEFLRRRFASRGASASTEAT